MIRVVIVEDEILVADHLSSILSGHGCKPVAISETIADAMETLAVNPDLYLLDIRLAQNGNGIEFGGRLKALGIPFIYITANNEIGVLRKAIETGPVTYITKPFNERDVIAAVEMVRFKQSAEKSISIIGNRGMEKLPEQDILFCKADGVYTEIHTASQSIVQRIKLKELEVKLSGNFVRIHRSYVINRKKISSRKANSVFLGDIELPVSRSYKEALED